jgi:hypothetical protein
LAYFNPVTTYASEAMAAEFVGRRGEGFLVGHGSPGDSERCEPAMLLVPQPSKIQSRLEFECDPAFDGAGIEDAPQFVQRGRMLPRSNMSNL